jgi:hypothetical protein
MMLLTLWLAYLQQLMWQLGLLVRCKAVDIVVVDTAAVDTAAVDTAADDTAAVAADIVVVDIVDIECCNSDHLMTWH